MADPARVAAAKKQVTQGALNAIFNKADTLQKEFPIPVCQCVQIKQLGNPGDSNAPERYRIVLSDITNFVQSMLATQANHVVHEGKLKKGSFVRLKSYQANEVKGKRILIILELEVIESLGELEKIGEPVGLVVKEESADVKPNMNTTIAGNGFYGNNNNAHQAVVKTERALPTHPSSQSAHIYPIEGLSPYAGKWTIKARCTTKSDIRTWHKANGAGKLFSVNLLDESGEIRATGFNDQCDSFYELFQEGSVYYISSAKVQIVKNKQYSNLSNTYEIMFERDTVVEKCEDVDNVPQIRFNFTSIQDLQDAAKDSTVEVIGVLKEVGDVNEIMSKAQKPFSKRDLTIVDATGYSVRVTIWGKDAQTFEAPQESIVAFKGAKVGDFGGRSLSLLSSGSMSVDPDIAEAHQLKGWYDSQGKNGQFASHSNMASMGAAGGQVSDFKNIGQVKEEGLGQNTDNEKGDYFSTRATIVYTKNENFAYPACSSEGCNKKVIDVGDGWRCEKCEITHPKPQYRYILNISVQDAHGQIYLSCFDDIGRQIMGMSGDELMELQENDPLAKEKVFEDTICKMYNFKVRAKPDMYQDQVRVRYQVMNCTPVNYAAEANKLAALIKSYSLE